MISSRVALLAFLIKVVGSTTSCIKSLSQITSNEYFRDESRTATYTICPNTVFSISDPKPSGFPSSDDDSALQVRKSNIHIKCGDDGASGNNCIFLGGSYQLQIDRPTSHGAIYNVMLQGITFRGATVNNLIASASGTLNLNDCVFKDNDNIAVIVAIPPYRSQDKDFGPSLLVRISDSVFLDNRSESGLAVFDSASVEITDSIFAGSTTRRPRSVPTYLLRVEHGDILMKDNCFFGNDETITPIAANRGIAQAYGTFYQRRGPGIPLTGCHFMAEAKRGSLDDEDFELSQFNCYAPRSANVCEAKGYNVTSIDHKFPCEATLNDIYQRENDLDDSTYVRSYILCPRTTYLVGSSNEEPLVFGRPNVHVLCGADGKSSNGCVLDGGSTQLKVTDAFADDSGSADNTLVQGVTFTHGQTSNIAVDFPCNLLIRKCIFTENENSAVIRIDAAEDNADSSDRRVIVMESAFAANKMGTKGGSSTGLIVNMGGSLKVEDCAFLGNEDVKEDSRFASYLVGNINGELEMTGNCFVENDIEFAAAIHHSPHEPVVRNNYGPARSEEECEFMAVTDPGKKDAEFKCIGFDRPTCYVKHGFSVGFSSDQDTKWTVKVETTSNIDERIARWSLVLGLLVPVAAIVAL